MRQAQKMEAVGRLAGGVAHDFNNMLGVILGYTDILLEEADDSLPFYTELSAIKDAGKRSADLTRQLLAFARKQTVAPMVLNLNKTLTEIAAMLERLIGEDIKLVLLPGDKLWQVKIDPGQIHQIITNLCVNSRDAIAGVGTLTIETENSTLDEVYCAENSESIPGEYVRMTVSDTGCGIDADSIGNIFEPFFHH